MEWSTAGLWTSDTLHKPTVVQHTGFSSRGSPQAIERKHVGTLTAGRGWHRRAVNTV